ncbi:MAG: response regulator [Kofleriaceae bacterium]|nr:response regulator [Kofleriaceae bacterium]
MVDDSPAQRHYVADCLSRQGRDVVTAENGKIGLDKARAQRPALVVSATRCAVMTGFELVHALRRDPELRQVPVIMLTARDSRRDMAQMRAAGGSAYLVKPFAQDKCVAMVARTLAARRRSWPTRRPRRSSSPCGARASPPSSAQWPARSSPSAPRRWQVMAVMAPTCTGFTPMSQKLSPRQRDRAAQRLLRRHVPAGEGPGRRHRKFIAATRSWRCSRRSAIGRRRPCARCARALAMRGRHARLQRRPRRPARRCASASSPARGVAVRRPRRPRGPPRRSRRASATPSTRPTAARCVARRARSCQPVDPRRLRRRRAGGRAGARAPLKAVAVPVTGWVIEALADEGRRRPRTASCGRGGRRLGVHARRSIAVALTAAGFARRGPGPRRPRGHRGASSPSPPTWRAMDYNMPRMNGAAADARVAAMRRRPTPVVMFSPTPGRARARPSTPSPRSAPSTSSPRPPARSRPIWSRSPTS